MHHPLATAIEIYLLATPRWVPLRELENVFSINERDLRAKGKQRPICGRFAISSAAKGRHGLKHIMHASIDERLAHKHKNRRVLIAAARNDRDYENALRNALDARTPQSDLTGQTILPL
jgi:hypothetical protein